MAITPKNMKPNIPAEQTIRLASENSAKLAFFTELTGLPADELVTWLLAD